MAKESPIASSGGGAPIRGTAGIGARGVSRPGYQIGSSKTSPVPGMSRTQAAINSLTKKGQGINEGRIEAVMSDNVVESGLQGRSGQFGGQHMGGHAGH